MNFVKRFLKSKNDTGNSSNNETFKWKTDEGLVETDSVPEPPRPQPSRSENSKNFIPKINKNKKKMDTNQTNADEPTEIGFSKASGNASDEENTTYRNSFQSFEGPQQAWISPPPTMFTIKNIIGCTKVHIGNDNNFVSSSVVYNYPESGKTASESSVPKAEEQGAKKEMLDQIKKGFSCMDQMTNEDKRIVQMYFTGKWQILATMLGYSLEEIKRWEKDPKFPREKSEAIGKILNRWEKTSAATVGTLCVNLEAHQEFQTAFFLALAHS